MVREHLVWRQCDRLDDLWNPAGSLWDSMASLSTHSSCLPIIWLLLQSELFISTVPVLWVVWFSQHLWGFCKERKLCANSGVGSNRLSFGKGTKLLVTPSKFLFLANYSFRLIILSKKPIFHHAKAVKTQVVFSLLGLCWVVHDTSWKTRLLMYMFSGALYLAFNIHVVSPWENMWASLRRKFQGKYRGKRQELDENRQRACRNNKQDGIPEGQAVAVATLSEFPRSCPCQGLFFPGKLQQRASGWSC